MNKILLPLTLLAICGFAVMVAFNSNAQETTSTMLSRLQVGQRVKLDRAVSGGYNINVLSERHIKNYERTRSLPTIIAVRRDFIVVADKGIELTISAHAIHVITIAAPGAAKVPAKDRKDR